MIKFSKNSTKKIFDLNFKNIYLLAIIDLFNIKIKSDKFKIFKFLKIKIRKL